MVNALLSAAYMKRKATLAAIITILLLVPVVFVRYFVLRPERLTDSYRQEMHDAIIQFEQTNFGIESHRDPTLLSQVAAGEVLEYLERIRCTGDCSLVTVAINLNIEDLKVLTYSENSAKVFARVEIASASVSPLTGKILSPCRASAAEETYTFVRDDGNWKVIRVETEFDTRTPLHELELKVCPELPPE